MVSMSSDVIGNVGGLTDDERTDGPQIHDYTISSPMSLISSGEIKIKNNNNNNDKFSNIVVLTKIVLTCSLQGIISSKLSYLINHVA